MKTCEKSNNCCYGSCSMRNTCAYNPEMENDDPCPLYVENWEEIIDKLIDKKVILEDILHG